MLAPAINYLRSHNLTDIVAREFTGNNVPHVLIVRSEDELVDQSIAQFGNTAACFGGSLLLDKGYNRLATGLGLTARQMALPWFHFGKSMAVLGFMASVLLAMPFFRNYITTSRTKTLDYADMIGEKVRKNNSKQALKEKLSGYLRRAVTTLAIGTVLSGALFAGTVVLAKSRISMPKALQWLHSKIGLPGGKFENLTDWSAVPFWVIPTYLGFIMASRDGYELKELLLRFGAFNLAFFVFPHTVERGINHLAQRVTVPKFIGSSANMAYLGRFLSSLVFCSAVPTVLNIYLTRQRVKRDAAKQAVAPPQSMPTPRVVPATVSTLMPPLPKAANTNRPWSWQPVYPYGAFQNGSHAWSPAVKPANNNVMMPVARRA